MDGPTRARIAAAAERSGTALVLDESLIDLPLHTDTAPEPFAMSAGPDAVTISVGSLSKVHWGGLRVGWLRAPAPLVDELAADRTVADIGSPVIEQLVALTLLEHHDEVAAERRALLRSAYGALTESLATELPGWSYRPPAGGIAAWVDIGAPLSTRLAVAAVDHGVRLTSGPRFGTGGSFERHIRIPFVLPPADLRAAITRLAVVAAGLGPTPRVTDHDAVI